MTHGEKVRAFVLGVNLYVIPTVIVFACEPEWALWQKLIAVPAGLLFIVVMFAILTVLG